MDDEQYWSSLANPSDDYWSSLANPATTSQTSFMDKAKGYGLMLGNTALDEVLGAGDSARNTIANILNVIPGVKIPLVKSSSGNAYEVGKFAGDVGSFMAAGELKGPELASETIPYLGKLAAKMGGEGLAGGVNRAAGTAAYGATQNPENRGMGALEGAALSAGGDIAGAGLKAISPVNKMKEAYQQIAQGLENAKNESKVKYSKIMGEAGDKELPIMSQINLDKIMDQTDLEDLPKLKEIYLDFKQSPTVMNAHELQSQLGSLHRKIIPTDKALSRQKNKLYEARELTKKSIDKSLEEIHPDLKKEYLDASKHYRKEVIPREMTHTALENMVQPTPEKVITKLEAVSKSKSYPKRTDGVHKIPLVPEDISSISKGLEGALKNKKLAQIIGTGVIGGGATAAANKFHLPLAEQLGAGALGGAIPTVASLLSSKFGNKSLSSANKSQLPKLLSKALKGYLLGNNSKGIKPMELTVNRYASEATK